jgi:hypothetical protein
MKIRERRASNSQYCQHGQFSCLPLLALVGRVSRLQSPRMSSNELDEGKTCAWSALTYKASPRPKNDIINQRGFDFQNSPYIIDPARYHDKLSPIYRSDILDYHRSNITCPRVLNSHLDDSHIDCNSTSHFGVWNLYVLSLP